MYTSTCDDASPLIVTNNMRVFHNLLLHFFKKIISQAFRCYDEEPTVLSSSSSSSLSPSSLATTNDKSNIHPDSAWLEFVGLTGRRGVSEASPVLELGDEVR